MNLRSIRITAVLWTMLAALMAVLPTVHSAEGDFAVDVQTVAKDTSVTFVVTADGSPAPKFQWLKDGVNIPGATDAKLELGKVNTISAGVYNALAVNEAGWALSNDLVLIVDEPAVAPVFTSHPSSSTELPGSSIILSSACTGSPVPTYQWRKNGEVIAGATGSKLSLIGISESHAGAYTVTASNIAGATTSNPATLVVSARVSGVPVITKQPPANLTAKPLSVVLIPAAASGEGLSYQWLKNGMAINHPRWRLPTLELRAATTNDNASYTLRVTNAAGSVVSSATILRVTSAIAVPTFTVQPISQSVTLGATVVFNALASGSPSPTYQWFKNGIALVGSTNSSLILPSVSRTQAGQYSAVASNNAGSATSSVATLTIGSGSPVITLQPPANLTAKPLSVVLIPAAASGEGLSYQWLKNGMAINHPRWRLPTLELRAATTNDNASYTLRVTNAAGSVVSSATVLRVK